MKYDLKAFSRDIVTLIKTSGDTGGSGDKSDKSLQYNSYSVPTHETVASPLQSEWRHPSPTSGDRKSKQFESVIKNVPSVPTATTNVEEGRTPKTFEDTSAGWHAILAELEGRTCPDWMPHERWDLLLGDAENFLTQWGSTANALGWWLSICTACIPSRRLPAST
jgi:hypothetical protein